MPKMTPSKEKIKIACKFIQELSKLQNTTLKAAFVYGSVAANMALPESDTDLLLVCEDRDAMEEVISRVLNGPFRQEYKKGRLMPISIFSTTFQKAKKSILHDGAIPIFGQEYANRHKGAWKYPEKETIIRRYSLDSSRLKFKRRKSARVILPHLRGR